MRGTRFLQKKSKKKGDSFTVYKTSGFIHREKTLPPFTTRVLINPGKNNQATGWWIENISTQRTNRFKCSSQTFTVSRTAKRWFVSLFLLDVENFHL
jgi:putative transposase